MKAIDWHQYFRSWMLILFGVIAVVGGAVRGEVGIVGIGVLSTVVGSGLLALAIWNRRNPLR